MIGEFCKQFRLYYNQILQYAYKTEVHYALATTAFVGAVFLCCEPIKKTPYADPLDKINKPYSYSLEKFVGMVTPLYHMSVEKLCPAFICGETDNNHSRGQDWF